MFGLHFWVWELVHAAVIICHVHGICWIRFNSLNYSMIMLFIEKCILDSLSLLLFSFFFSFSLFRSKFQIFRKSCWLDINFFNFPCNCFLLSPHLLSYPTVNMSNFLHIPTPPRPSPAVLLKGSRSVSGLAVAAPGKQSPFRLINVLSRQFVASSSSSSRK